MSRGQVGEQDGQPAGRGHQEALDEPVADVVHKAESGERGREQGKHDQQARREDGVGAARGKPGTLPSPLSSGAKSSR